MTRSALRPVFLRHEVDIDDPLTTALGFFEAYRHLDKGDTSPPSSFGEPDLRRANRGGARISAAEIAAILERRRAIERALRAIPAGTSLGAPESSLPWRPLTQLLGAFAGIRGVGFSKSTKALHPKRPALVPMLDSVVQSYLEADDPGAGAPFRERAVALVRGYKRDLDRNRVAVGAVRKELAKCGYDVTEVRILDVLIWSAFAAR